MTDSGPTPFDAVWYPNLDTHGKHDWINSSINENGTGQTGCF